MKVYLSGPGVTSRYEVKDVRELFDQFGKRGIMAFTGVQIDNIVEIEDGAYIGTGVVLSDCVHIGKCAVIMDGARVGAEADVGAFARIGRQVVIPKRAIIPRNAVIACNVTEWIDLGHEPERGYTRSMQLHPVHGLLVQAGCRVLTPDQARQHWGDYYPKRYQLVDKEKRRARGDAYLRLIDYAEKEARALGWIK